MTKINVLDLAAYIRYRYEEENHAEIDEMKIHKLLYFSQRESLIRQNMPLFDDVFKAWKFGPVMPSVRMAYKNESIFERVIPQLTNEQREIMDYVFEYYSKKDSWSLSRLTHGEYSWKVARSGVSEFENSNEDISLENIKYDAEQQINRRKNLQELGLLEENN